MSNNDNHDDNLQLFDWLLTNSMVDMTTTNLPVNNVPGNEALGNVNSFQALFDSPLPQAMSFSPLQVIPTQQQTTNGLAMNALTQSTFNTPPSTTLPAIHNTPRTQSTSSASPDGRGSSNSGASLSEEHVQEVHGEKASDKRQQEDQNDHPSESELKKMTSKERRQLRNKISARKFRSRKKEYVTTLETDLQHQKHENERLNLEVSFIRANADKLQKERDDLKLQLALCREKNRELMRRLDKGGSSSSASRPPEKNNDDNRTPSPSPSSSSSGPNAPNASHQNTNSLSANNKMHSLEKSLPIETAVTNATNIAPPSPPSSPQHHTHSLSKSYQQDIIVQNDDNNNGTSSLRSNSSLVAALIWTLLGYSMTILASQDNAYHDRSLPPAPSSIEDTTRSRAKGSRMHSKSSMRGPGTMTGSERLMGKNHQERSCTVLEPSSTIHSRSLVHSHQSIYQHSHHAYTRSSSLVT